MLNKMQRVYVAGAYSSDNVIGVLDNIREGMRLATRILLAGFAPFCPWFDFHFQLMLRDGESLEVNDYYKYSIAWLDVADCLVVGDWPGCEKSKGTLAEIANARQKNIPIFYSPEEFFDSVGLQPVYTEKTN